MGNLSDSEKSTNTLAFMESLENSFITASMLNEMIERWTEYDKPLFMAHKEFRDKILQNMEGEAKLNYYKWSTA
jgi:hypothetical protein